MGKRFFKFTALISLIFFAINVDVLAEGDSDDHACPDGDQGPVHKLQADMRGLAGM